MNIHEYTRIDGKRASIRLTFMHGELLHTYCSLSRFVMVCAHLISKTFDVQ